MLSKGLAIVIGVLVLAIVVMIAVVFTLVYKKVGGCSGAQSNDTRAGLSSSSSCPGYQPLPTGTTVTSEWIHKNISPCPNGQSQLSCYYQNKQGELCINGAKHTFNEDVCSSQWCPYGMQCNATKGCVNVTPSLFSNTDLTSRTKLLTQAAAGPNPVEIKSLKPDPNRYVPRPTLALYHGGVVGLAETDANVFRNYMQTVATFCQEKSIDMFLMSLDSYTPAGKKGNQYPYLQNPSYLASIVDGVFARTCPNTTLGVVAYVRPKDAGWTDDPTAYGGCIADTTCGNGCEFVHPGPQGCPRYCTTDPGDKDLPLCPPGCPNQLAQAISYVGKVNNAISAKNKLEAFVFDGEDAGDYASGCGFHVARQASAKYAQHTISNFGYAKALQAGAVCYPGVADEKGNCPKDSKPVSTMVFPETYWFMNDLWPCTGSAAQLASRPPVCTTQTSYQRFKDQPVAFLNYLQEADRCGYGSNGLTSLENNLKGPYGDQIWPMFSLEKLSTIVNTNGTAGGPSSCLAMAYSAAAVNTSGPQAGWPAQSDLCGTFDGFGTWQWDTFLQFISLFAYVYGATKVGIYEAQFLPWSTTQGGRSWVNPVNPVPPTIPKTCENDCSYCTTWTCNNNQDCDKQLKTHTSCNATEKVTYTTYCEANKCKIKAQPTQSTTCISEAANWTCNPDTLDKGFSDCNSQLMTSPYCHPPYSSYRTFCRSNNICQVQCINPSGC